MKNNFILIILLIAFSIPAVSPLFHPGFFQSDDGEWMVIRFSAFYQAFADGQFPVRFLGRLNHEYGYPVANFLYPGFMYLGIPIHVLGFGFVDTIKIIFGASMIFSSIFCFLWLSKFFDKLSSFVGSLFYLYTPYHLFDLYKRGSVGEVLALAVLPFILWQIERKSFFWSSIGIAALILSHNTLAILFLGLIVLYMGLDAYVSKDRSGLLRKYLLTLMFGLGMSPFFWIPAFFELKYTVFSQTQISDFNSYFANIDLVGFSTIFVLLLTAVFMITSIIKVKKHRLTLLLFIIGLISVFFSTSLSAELWKILPVSFIQFPFRLLSLTIVCVAFLAAVINTLSLRNSGDPSVDGDSRISNGSKRFWTRRVPDGNPSSQNDVKKGLVAILLIFFLAISAFPFLLPKQYFDKGEGFYATNMDTTTVKNEYMPKWVKQKPVGRFVEKVEIVKGVGKAMPAGRQVENVSYNSKKITFDVLAEEDMKVRVNTIYYPGWNAKVNSQNEKIDYQNEKGVMELGLPKGENKVELTFSETPLRVFSDVVSIFSFVVLVILSSRILLRRI